jgi:hypothetical protein
LINIFSADQEKKSKWQRIPVATQASFFEEIKEEKRNIG